MNTENSEMNQSVDKSRRQQQQQQLLALAEAEEDVPTQGKRCLHLD